MVGTWDDKLIQTTGMRTKATAVETVSPVVTSFPENGKKSDPGNVVGHVAAAKKNNSNGFTLTKG